MPTRWVVFDRTGPGRSRTIHLTESQRHGVCRSATQRPDGRRDIPYAGSTKETQCKHPPNRVRRVHQRCRIRSDANCRQVHSVRIACRSLRGRINRITFSHGMTRNKHGTNREVVAGFERLVKAAAEFRVPSVLVRGQRRFMSGRAGEHGRRVPRKASSDLSPDSTCSEKKVPGCKLQPGTCERSCSIDVTQYQY